MSRTETGAGRVLPHRRRRPDVGTDTVKGSQRVRSSGCRARRRRSFEPGGKHGEAGPRRVRSRRRAHRGGRAQDLGRRPARGDRDRPPGRRADGLAQGRPHPAAPQPARRLRLPRVRLARTAPHVARRVLRERGQGRRRGGHRSADHAGVLRRALDRVARRRDRLLARSAGPPDDADAPSAGRDALRADRLGRRDRPHRRRARHAGVAAPRRVLHVGAHEQRGRLRVPADGAGARHQQPPGLLEHVPRVERRGPRARRSASARAR